MLHVGKRNLWKGNYGAYTGSVAVSDLNKNMEMNVLLSKSHEFEQKNNVYFHRENNAQDSCLEQERYHPDHSFQTPEILGRGKGCQR